MRLVLIVALLALGARWASRFFDADAHSRAKQAANHERVAFYADALQRHYEFRGTYPLNLIDSLEPTEIPGGIAQGVPLRDAWDHPMRYFSDGKIFLLVSVGRDGEPDGSEYQDLRKPGAARDICGEPDADVVVSDLGWHVACLESP